MKERERFGSRLGFILISAGCAIGLGNVWRCPYITGKYGGAAFVLVYLFFLVALGLPIMVMEFAVGRASQRRAFEAGQTALNYLLHAKKIPPQNLVLWGFSLGNSICLHTAVQNAALPFKAVVAQSPFTSSTEMAAYGVSKHYKPWDWKQKILLPFIYLILWNRRLDNTHKIPRVKAPLLVAYSKQDERIPWQMSAALARLAPHGTQAYASPRGSHGEFGWLEKRALDFLASLK